MRSWERDDHVVIGGGLLGYQGLRERLAIDGKKPCLRTVKALVAKHRAVIRPVILGHRTVGFRPARVEALLAHLAGDDQPGPTCSLIGGGRKMARQ